MRYPVHLEWGTEPAGPDATKVLYVRGDDDSTHLGSDSLLGEKGGVDCSPQFFRRTGPEQDVFSSKVLSSVRREQL